MELPYKEIYTTNPTDARKKIVQTDLQTGSACRGVRSYAPTCAPPAKRHDAGTHPPNACASGCNATNNTATQ